VLARCVVSGAITRAIMAVMPDAQAATCIMETAGEARPFLFMGYIPSPRPACGVKAGACAPLAHARLNAMRMGQGRARDSVA
jgi:hypothetical protein